MTYFWIMLGSALGGGARFWLSNAAASRFGETFPWGTIIVNISGSFVIGFFATLTGPDGRLLVSPIARQFVMIGLCGGFTTFSSFSLQTLNLARDGDFFRAGANAVLSLGLCLFAVWLGHVAASMINAPAFQSAGAGDVEAERRRLLALEEKTAAFDADNRDLDEKLAELSKAAAENARAGALGGLRANLLRELAEKVGGGPQSGVVGERFAIASPALFGKSLAALDSDGRAILDRVAEALFDAGRMAPPDLPWLVRIDGHASASPVGSRRFASNTALSFERAEAVLHYLIARGVPPQRLAVAAFGSSRPLQEPAGAAVPADLDNRRIELTITEK